MKAFKLFLLTLFAALGLAAQAQTIEVYKDGQVIDTFSAAQVDSVVYKYAEPQARYYYYAGWECPTTETELANKGTLIGTSLGTYTKSNPLRLFSADVTTDTVGKYYLVIPENIHIYDGEGDSLVEDNFDVITNISINGYKIFQSQVNVKRINGIMLR